MKILLTPSCLELLSTKLLTLKCGFTLYFYLEFIIFIVYYTVFYLYNVLGTLLCIDSQPAIKLPKLKAVITKELLYK